MHLHQFISYHLFMVTTCDDSILPKLANRYGHLKLAAGHVHMLSVSLSVL